MATITGKRFQMTDGAASPINLFPYTVSEAVYGLNNSISNAISSALSTISLSTYAGESAIGSSVQPVYYNGSALVATDLSTTYAPYNSAGYLPLTGGEINNASVSSNDTPLRIYSGSTTGSFIQFRSKNSEASGYIGASVSNGLTYADSVGQSFSIWHAGNSNNRDVDWSCATLTATACVLSDTGTYGTFVRFDNTNYSGYKYIGPHSAHLYDLSWYNGSDWCKVYHSGNSNLSTVPWACSTLTANGNILSTGDQIINSDLTMKTNLKDVTYSVSDIAKCRAVTFDWRDGHGHSAGSIAQDWKPLIPELVHGEEGNMTLAYGQIALVNSILEAREIERLKERVAELENQLKMRS